MKRGRPYIEADMDHCKNTHNEIIENITKETNKLEILSVLSPSPDFKEMINKIESEIKKELESLRTNKKEFIDLESELASCQ